MVTQAIRSRKNTIKITKDLPSKMKNRINKIEEDHNLITKME